MHCSNEKNIINKYTSFQRIYFQETLLNQTYNNTNLSIVNSTILY